MNNHLEVARVLQNDYGFKVKLLLDANRTRILLSLNQLRSQMTEGDNLLIYYAGHGWLDKEGDKGYWLPVDAERQNTVNWVSNSSITTVIKTLKISILFFWIPACLLIRFVETAQSTDKTLDESNFRILGLLIG